MKRIFNAYLLLLLLFGSIAATLPPISNWVQELTKEQQAGKDVYTNGKGSSNVKVMASMSGVEVPATVMACINCHNANGTGNPEGGITPSNITWPELTKSYGGKRQDGSSRPPYNERTLRTVITSGIDPGGNKLHTAMPRYSMTRADIDNLIAYMKVLGSDTSIGVTDSSIQIGIALPESKTIPNSRNEAIEKIVTAFCKELNAAGGIYNRTLEIRFFNKQEAFKQNECFFVLGFGDKSVELNVNKNGVPALFSFSNEKTESGFHNPFAFYAYPSLTAQSLSLVDFSEKKGLINKQTSATIVYYNDTIRKPIAEKLDHYFFERFGRHSQMIVVDWGGDSVEKIAANNSVLSDGLIFYLGPDKLGNRLLNALQNENKTPAVLLPGSISGIDLFNMPPGFRNKVYIGYPTWISEQTNEGMQAYRVLNQNYALSPNWKRSQLDILSLLLTAEECLKLAGFDVTRDHFKKTLESLFQYSNGLSPALTYGLDRRVGNSNVYIVGFDSEENKMNLVTTIQGREE